jgi:hypothetical protein
MLPEEQQIIFAGQNLEDEHTIGEYGVKARKHGIDCSGSRYKKRTRSIIQQPMYGGRPCPSLVETVECETPKISTLVLEMPAVGTAANKPCFSTQKQEHIQHGKVIPCTVPAGEMCMCSHGIWRAQLDYRGTGSAKHTTIAPSELANSLVSGHLKAYERRLSASDSMDGDGNESELWDL